MIDKTSNEQHYVMSDHGRPLVDMTIPRIGDILPELEMDKVDDDWTRVRLTWDLDKVEEQDEVAVAFDLTISPDFWWAPHLAPEDGYCIAQHVFRSPALIAAEGPRTIIMVPDLEICGSNPKTPWFMDFDAPERKMWLGMSKTEIPAHVCYRKTPGMTLGPGRVELGFFITTFEDQRTPRDPWAKVSRFLWARYAQPLYQQGQPSSVPMDTYVDHTYNWAFNTWEDAVWQEFDLDGKRVGAPAFIVNITQSPNYPKEPSLREFLSIWNQAWFSSLRSASGVYRYARRTEDADLLRRAKRTLDFALSAPMKDGIFPSVYRTEMERVDVDGHAVSRSKGWATGYWTNSNRTPGERGVSDKWYHTLDASWTGLLLLHWYDELEQDQRILDYAQTYADRLLTLQDEDGFFPAWLHPDTQEPSAVLRASPETSMHVTFLLKMAEVTGDDRYRAAALKAMEAVLEEIVSSGRWEDYETYWSCCQWGKNEYLGKKIERNAMYKQNTLSMFWTSEALLACYRVTGEKRYLDWGVRTLHELSMAQQVWQPPYIYVPALGGFGVMNFDGEWNDSRQSLFAELFLEYYKETGDSMLFERGICALKASFIMMYCPENPVTFKMWEKVYDFFGPEDYGFMMENYGHDGWTTPEGRGMGVFTIYDWGNGAASEARNRIRDHWGDVYIDSERQQAFGMDSIRVTQTNDGCLLTDETLKPRTVKIVFDDGRTQEIELNQCAEIVY